MLSITLNLREREMDRSIHNVWVDGYNHMASFPLTDLNGSMTGFQQYRPNKSKRKSNHPRDARYFTYCVKDRVSVWGMESWNFTNTLFITEGIFDACRLTHRGMSALAVLSCDVSTSLRKTFMFLRKIRPIVVICDNDGNNSGNKLAKLGNIAYTVPNKGDLGDSPLEVLEEIKKEYLIL